MHGNNRLFCIKCFRANYFFIHSSFVFHFFSYFFHRIYVQIDSFVLRGSGERLVFKAIYF